MSRTQPEARIVAAILRRLNSIPDTYARKTHGNAYSSGWPDIIGSSAGRMFGIEVKQPGKKATPMQVHELAKWGAAGALVGVATTVDEAVDIAWPKLYATNRRVVLVCDRHGVITTPIDTTAASDCVHRHHAAGCNDTIHARPANLARTPTGSFPDE